MPATATPPHPDWKQDDGPEGPDELELTAEDLIITGSCCSLHFAKLLRTVQEDMLDSMLSARH